MAAPSPPDLVFDPDARLANVSCFDLLLIELVPLAERMARAYEASLDRPVPPVSSGRASKRASRGGGTPATGSTMVNTNTTVTTSGAGSGSGTGTGTGNPAITVTNPNATSTSLSAPPSTTTTTAAAPTLLASDGMPSTPLFADSVYVRLERLGFRVGEGLSERFSRDRARFQNYAGSGPGMAGSGGLGTGSTGSAGTAGIGSINDHHLDVIKFLCKDIWTVVWKKQVDNLKTNHRGVFVLTDAKFRPLMRMAMTTSAEAVQRAQPHLFFPCGIIRGVLSSLGIKATVQAETTDLPGAVFQIKTIQEPTKKVGV
ncbi:hypothetical protein G647_05235 [Cladophialophora carrionii CBS 160.54]|uniref:Trafficking protein particle complex subunit 6B n=1 Tax=Cladophialophora carrionii CBS 160.54 TaxID=1279043 RepID=V9DAW2_9EURO|nr:uncharacterized protein G647_05235 [Cladophialophora carrionii CBS 160.54]ETI23433.1 hypothetical protein G647_05235 [Cladophialophora carrionii CBS 160.54]